MPRLLAYLVPILPLANLGCTTMEDQYGLVPTAVGNIPFAYHAPVQQGNVVTQEMVNQLQVGMDRNQVLFIMGTPTIVDPFRDNRWDYVYNRFEDNELVEEYQYTLFFENDRLVSMQGDFQKGLSTNPAPTQQVIEVPMPAD